MKNVTFSTGKPNPKKEGKIIISTRDCVFVNNKGVAIKFMTSQVPGKCSRHGQATGRGDDSKLSRFNRLRELALTEWFAKCYQIAFELFDYFEIDGKAANEFLFYVIENEGKKNES